MRTTLTLDDDVAAALDKLRRASGKTHKQIVNDLLRLGLREAAGPAPALTPYRTPAASLGRCLVGSVDDVSEVLAVAEGEDFR